MKRFIIILILFSALGQYVSAQVVNVTDNLAGRQSEVKVSVLDSLSKTPLGFASVYLIPDKDSVITNFSLTDPQGKAVLDEVPYGAYSLHVEMLGYHPRRIRTYLRSEKVDIGTLLMVQDPTYLDAAVVSDVGNPIIVKKDTLIFNAASFRTRANAMLKDLLLKLPGVEITEDGRVKINGELVDKVTVGGRTFFFDDQSMALNNLPASIVERISFIDRGSEMKRATGIEDGSREKVMDVTLKKEYEKGWFGNLAVRGGTSAGKKDEELRDNRGFLYKSNALVAAYSDKDQVTVVGNAVNVTDEDVINIVDNGDGIYSTAESGGLVTTRQIGTNVNTIRIKDVESTAMVNYRNNALLSGNRSSRTSFLSEGDLLTDSKNSGTQNSNQVTGQMEFKKEDGKVWFYIRPSIQYRSSHSFSNEETATSQGGILLNGSSTQSACQQVNKNAGFDGSIIFRDLFGRPGRSLTLTVNGKLLQENGQREDVSRWFSSSGTQTYSYEQAGVNRQASGDLTYTEPIAEKWTLLASAGLSAGSWKDQQDAFGVSSAYPEALSFCSDILSFQQKYEGSVQYTFSEDVMLRLGLRTIGFMDKVDSERLTSSAGSRWHWFLAPVATFSSYRENTSFSFSVLNYAARPSRGQLAPVPNISRPSYVLIGNAYLKSGYVSIFQAMFAHENPERFSSLFGSGSLTLNSSPVTSAQWYNPFGVSYSVPVNGIRPSMDAFVRLSYTFPLGSKKAWFVTLRSGADINRSASYLSNATREGIDVHDFSYAGFMDGFWGDDEGSRFYSGDSGFKENITLSTNCYVGGGIKFTTDQFSIRTGYDFSPQYASYSLLPTVKRKTWDQEVYLNADYTTRHEFEFSSKLSYVDYHGYADGFGLPEWIWNVEVSKDVGPFNLSIQAHDLLDQTRNLSRVNQANYEETSYRLIMGRYILFGVRWNFGKMNATQNERAANAALEMSM